MKILYKGFDGGETSTVVGYWLVEIKSLFSVCLLKFNGGTRENFHSHAFNAFTWFISGDLTEERLADGKKVFTKYKRSWLPKVTKRNNIHRVTSVGASYCFSIRGPWVDYWQEYNEKTNKWTTLTHGRKEVL